MKKILAVIALMLVIGGVAYLSQSNDHAPSSTTNDLTAEQKITHAHGLSVDIKDPSKLYIATHHGLLVLLNDNDLYRIGKSKNDLMGFSAHPTIPETFFSSGHPTSGGNIGFQQSNDGGITWTNVSKGVNGPVDFHAMTISPVNSDIIYGWYQGTLQRSDDAGKNWIIVNSEIKPISLIADTKDENKVYATTPKGLSVSTDKGVTWSILENDLTGDAVTALTINPNDPNSLIAFSIKLQGLGKSNDAGKTWSKINENFNNETILHLATSSGEPNIVYALSQNNSLYKTNDGGVSWKKIK
jgi:photosystem II stability/assembly factor-like uncharacterized protein